MPYLDILDNRSFKKILSYLKLTPSNKVSYKNEVPLF